jgi:multidrug resistance efflux pump
MFLLDEPMESPIIAKLPRGHHMDRRFGVVYGSAPETSDDLTQVDGVRTREVVMLNQLGIYFWGQIALWRHREIVAIAEELQIPVGRIIDENWTEQAKDLCRIETPRQSSTLPASVFRTISLLVCALLIGFFTVYLMGKRHNQALTGILSADITTIRVPAASRLTSVQIKAGEEVFSGQPLLTLEKLEHLSFIETQERLVRDLEHEVKRVEAQAAIELECRTRDLDRELSNVRQRIAMVELDGTTASRVPEGNLIRTNGAVPVRSVSSSNSLKHNAAPRGSAGGIIFFSGASGHSSPIPEPGNFASVPESVRTAELRRSTVVSDSVVTSTAIANLETLRTEQSRLEAVRAALPNMVNEAVGATTMQAHYTDAAKQLGAMKNVSREVNVTSPVYGTVGQVRYREGDDMQAGEVMLRILHTDRRYITAYLPTRRVHEMQVGQEVELRFPGDEQFAGQVVDVPMLADLTGNSGDTLTAVRIEQVGRLWPNVPVGSQIDVISSR